MNSIEIGMAVVTGAAMGTCTISALLWSPEASLRRRDRSIYMNMLSILLSAALLVLSLINGNIGGALYMALMVVLLGYVLGNQVKVYERQADREQAETFARMIGGIEN